MRSGGGDLQDHCTVLSPALLGVHMCSINHGSQVYCTNIRPETEIGGSLHKKYCPSEARAIFVCKLPMIEGEGV